VQQCIENCQQCHKLCEQLISYCLEKGGMHAERGHIETLLSCADICRTSSHFMMWNSDLHPRVCGVCADVCIKCAEDCERMSDDEMMNLCADVCRECAESCRRMGSYT
jgi:hypothetical protein